MSVISKRVFLGILVLTLQVGIVRANEELYNKVALSTVMVYKTGGPLTGSAGTGFVVDVKDRLVVTARHVVENTTGGIASVIEVMFAETRDGEIITESKHYQSKKFTSAVRCKVVYESARRDMAILQVEKLPAGIKALELSPKLARPGQRVHVVGNSSEPFGAVLSYCRGYVRNAFHWDYMGARVVTTHIPTNKGDSGGPMVNDLGQVVGFCAMSTSGQSKMPKTSPWYDFQVTELSICVSEIREGLKELRNLVLARPAPTFKGEIKSGIHTVTMEKDVTYRIAVTGEGFVPDVRVDNILLTPLSTSAKGPIQEALMLYVPKITKEHRIQICPYPGKEISGGPRPYTLSVDRAAFAGEANLGEQKLTLNEHVKKLEAGKAYNITVKGKGFEPDLQIFDGDKSVMTQLNNGMKAKSQGFFESIGLANAEFETTMRFVAPTSADYRILVSVGPFSPKGSGKRDYTINISEQRIELSVKDQLTAKDPLYPQAGHFKIHSLKLEAGKNYQIDLLTTAFDSKLVLEDAAGKMLATGFDTAGFNARLFFRPTKSGTYRIVATSHQADSTGAYTVTVMESVPVPSAFPPFKGPK
jgi:S1-C subfamily serine protease